MDEEVIIYEGKKKSLRQVKPRSMERGLPGLHFFFSHLSFKEDSLKGDN